MNWRALSMADKPKTYAQQVQELKDQKDELLTEIENMRRENSLIPELQEKISELNAQLAAHADQDRSDFVMSKAQKNDLTQRAEQAEQANRNVQAVAQQLKNEIAALHQQIEILENERLKHRGKDEKILLLHEELKSSNLRVAALNQQVRDQQVATNEAIAKMEKEVIYLRQLTKAQKDLITALTQEIEAIPYDGLQALRNLAKNG
jgi:chromosome segregation ATPase